MSQLSKDQQSTSGEYLAEAIREAHRQLWLSENQKALDDYAEYIEREGVFSESVRLF